MRYALTAEQIRAAEDRTVAEGAVTVATLMERAGAVLAGEVALRVPEGPVIVVCGPRNNGGDGWVAARLLHAASRPVRVVSMVAPASLRDEAAAAAEAALSAGVVYETADTEAPLTARFEDASVIVDALFGFGFHGAIREPADRLVATIATSGVFVISADMPSGVDADTGAVRGAAVRADVTVTFSAMKPGLLIYPGAAHAGEIVIADIGIPGSLLRVPDALEVPSATDLRPLLPSGLPDDHKGVRGRVAVVAGSRRYAGAAVLAAQGAARLGAGFVVAVVPDSIADILRISLPNILVRPVPETVTGAIASPDAVLAAVSDVDAVIAGPGLTTDDGVPDVVSALVEGVGVPLVLDADALNALAGLAVLDSRTAPLVLTPHPGEAARLLGTTGDAVQFDRLAAAVALTRGVHVCLLKGARSIVAAPGRRALVFAGNAGLARAGSGDVLTGMLGTLLARGLAPFDAALLAAHLHGRAAEFGTTALTETCFTSTDIVTFLPDAVREVQGE